MTKTSIETTTDMTATADALRPALLRLGRELRREARAVGVSTEQVAILVAIKHTPGVYAGDLAAAERVSPAAMSKLVSRLERDGLVERTPSESDRRRVGLALTADGHRMLRRVRSRRTAWLATRLGTLAPEEREAVAAAVEPLAKLLDAGEARA